MSKMDTWFRKHDPRRPKNPAEIFAFKDGEVMAILRPEDPAKKLAGLKKIKEGMPHERAQPLLQSLLDEQSHQFVGYAGKKAGTILNEWGVAVSTLQPGDSFVGCGDALAPPMFMRTGHFHTETWDGHKVFVFPRPDLKMDSNTGLVMDGPDRGAIALRGGAKEIDCHIPTLNRIITGDPNKDYREVLHAT